MKRILACGLVSLAPVVAAAEGLSYNYVQANYQSVDLDDTNVGATGFGVAASGLIAGNLFIFAEYGQAETDTFTDGIDSAKLKTTPVIAGLGYRIPLTEDTDVNAQAVFVHAKQKLTVDGLGSFSDNDNGYGVGLQIRHLFGPMFELNGSVQYIKIYDDGSTSFSVAALFHATKTLALIGGYTFSDDSKSWIAGVRLNF